MISNWANPENQNNVPYEKLAAVNPETEDGTSIIIMPCNEMEERTIEVS